MPRDGTDDARDDGLLHEWLCRRNISNFKTQLVAEQSKPRRLMLERLLLEEEARLRELLSSGELLELGSEAGYRAVISGLLGELQMETNPLAARRLRDRLMENFKELLVNFEARRRTMAAKLATACAPKGRSARPDPPAGLGTT
jgi:hypothetical protein